MKPFDFLIFYRKPLGKIQPTDTSAQKPQILYPPVLSAVTSKPPAPIFERKNPKSSNQQPNQQPTAHNRASTYKDLTRAGIGGARVTFDLNPDYNEDTSPVEVVSATSIALPTGL